MSALLLGIDQSFACGVFYRDRSYHTQWRHCWFYSRSIFLKVRGFLFKLSIVQCVWCVASWNKFMREISRNLRLKFSTVNIKNSNRDALVYVRRAHGKRIWSVCYFYTHKPNFLKSGTKSLRLTSKNINLNMKAAIKNDLVIIILE